LDLMVRDGLVNITKVEFLSCIKDVRRKAFKHSTILLAFKKTGIWPFNPRVILSILESHQAQYTPPPPDRPEESFSSPFKTPLTLRQINKVANKLGNVLEENKNLDPDFAHDLGRFIKGSLIAATELVQTKRDLGRTKYAERVQKQRKALKNTPLQSGGVLIVAEGRAMVIQKEEDMLAKSKEVG
jgi:hypothetical protein